MAIELKARFRPFEWFGAAPCGFFDSEWDDSIDHDPIEKDQIEKDKARMEVLDYRGRGMIAPEAMPEVREIRMRKARRAAIKIIPWEEEIEKSFAGSNLPPLPAALPRYSIELRGIRGSFYKEISLRPFIVACENGELDVVKQHIEQGHIDDSVLDDGLGFASRDGHLQVMEYLIQEGATLHSFVIKMAVRYRSLELFKFAVRHGYHPNQQIWDFLEGGIGVALPKCCDDTAIARFLLDHGADPNLGNFDYRVRIGWTLDQMHMTGKVPPLDRTCGSALSVAIREGNIEVVKLLLEHGAVARYAIPLHIALEKRRPWPETKAIMEVLIRHGADANQLGWLIDAFTFPLTLAIENQHWDAAEFLIENGANPQYAVNFAARVLGLDKTSEGSEESAGKTGAQQTEEQNPMVGILKRVEQKQAECSSLKGK
ncbi:hypothetical protein SUNI508_11736 [Seiridium unicorne]|uniref:Ankyrin n=1 Tax=Seiridium unicorne TaxID=138068 RepID=A0ABR2UGR7_9PEZI